MTAKMLHGRALGKRTAWIAMAGFVGSGAGPDKSTAKHFHQQAARPSRRGRWLHFPSGRGIEDGEYVLGGQASPDTRGILVAGRNPLAPAGSAANPVVARPSLRDLLGLALGSPEFQRR